MYHMMSKGLNKAIIMRINVIIISCFIFIKVTCCQKDPKGLHKAWYNENKCNYYLIIYKVSIYNLLNCLKEPKGLREACSMEVIMTINVICILIVRIIYFLFIWLLHCGGIEILIRLIWFLKFKTSIMYLTIQSENHVISCLINYS